MYFRANVTLLTTNIIILPYLSTNGLLVELKCKSSYNLSSIDWSIQTSEPLYQCILDKKDKLSQFQTIHFKTTNANILDLVVVSNQIEIIDTLPLDVFTAPKSDHKPINSIIRIKDLMKSSTFSKISFYSYCKADFNGLNDVFSISTFSPYCWSNVTKVVELWYERIHSFLQKFTPRRTQHRQNLPPWITSETSNSMKRLSTLCKQKGSQFALVIAMNEKVQTAVENDKSEYEQHLLIRVILKPCLNTIESSVTQNYLPS